MNEKFTNNMPSDEEKLSQKLNQVSEGINVNARCAADLEEKLRKVHPSQRSGFVASLRQISPTLRWVALMVLLALVLSWSIKTLIPKPQPAINDTPSNFVCPVTQPNGSLPPGTQTSESTNDANLLGDRKSVV